jgi:hypothetical protein
LKQFTLFDAPTAPTRKFTRKRIREAEQSAVPWAPPAWALPKLPTIAFFRSMALDGRYVPEGIVEVPLPRKPSRKPVGGRTKKGKSVIHKQLSAQSGADVPDEVWVDFPEIGNLDVSGWKVVFDADEKALMS